MRVTSTPTHSLGVAVAHKVTPSGTEYRVQHEPVTTPPLTLTELEEMLTRYAENAEVSKVIEHAIEQRLSGLRLD